ncbi:MAG: hypothetical protein FWD29_02570 [Micrococcales bacterium]|nr:hypothetical protein [Micrococcales bacterium]
MARRMTDPTVNVGTALATIGVAVIAAASAGTIAPLAGLVAPGGTMFKEARAWVRRKDSPLARAYAQGVTKEWLTTELAKDGDLEEQMATVAERIAKLLTRRESALVKAINDPTFPEIHKTLLAVGGQELRDSIEQSGGGQQVAMFDLQLKHVARVLESLRNPNAQYFKQVLNELKALEKMMEATAKEGTVKEVGATSEATHQVAVEILDAATTGDFAGYLGKQESFRPARDTLLDYLSGKVAFVGRTEERKRLHGFCDSEAKVAWAAITGPGGTGKSRLAYELCREYEKRGWRTLFLRDPFFEKTFSNWDYPQDLLVVVDYLTGRAARVGRWINELNQQARQHRLRLLLLDRNEFTTLGGSDGRESFGAEPTWYQQLTSGAGRGAEQRLHRDNDGRCVISLPQMTNTDMKETLRSVFVPANALDDVISRLNQIDQGHSRPLYLLYVAKAWLEDPAKAREVTATLASLLQFIYQHEKEIVEKACQQSEGSYHPSAVLDLWAYATVSGGIEDIRGLPSGSYAARTVDDGVSAGNRLAFAALIRSHAGSHAADVEPYTPDIAGEFLALTRARVVKDEDLTRLVSCAWANRPTQFQGFLERACLDFAEGTAGGDETGFGTMLVPDAGLLQPPSDADPCVANLGCHGCLALLESTGPRPKEAYALAMAGLANVVSADHAVKALRPLGELPGGVGEETQALSMAIALVNLAVDVGEPEQARQIIDGELKPLAADFPDNPDIHLPLAQALFNLTYKIGEPEQARQIIDDELKPLAANFPDNPNIHLLLAQALVNLTYKTGEPGQTKQIIDIELTPLAANFPDNPDIHVRLARALFNLAYRTGEPEQIRQTIDNELTPLAANFPDNPNIHLPLAQALVNLTYKTGEPEQIRQIIDNELKPLAANFPDNPEFNFD